MRREWFGIDRLRLDKFMMLVRKFTKSLFKYLQAQQWCARSCFLLALPVQQPSIEPGTNCNNGSCCMLFNCRDMVVVQQFMAFIEKDVLLSTDSHPAAGLMYHLADVYVVELKEVSRAGHPPATALAALLEPFCQVLAKSSRAAFLPRLRYSLMIVNNEASAVQHIACKATLYRRSLWSTRIAPACLGLSKS